MGRKLFLSAGIQLLLSPDSPQGFPPGCLQSAITPPTHRECEAFVDFAHQPPPPLGSVELGCEEEMPDWMRRRPAAQKDFESTDHNGPVDKPEPRALFDICTGFSFPVNGLSVLFFVANNRR